MCLLPKSYPRTPTGRCEQRRRRPRRKRWGWTLEDIEVRTRRLVKPESAVEPSTPSPRRVRATQVPKREEHDNHIGPPGLNVAYDIALKKLEENRCPNKGASNIVERAQYLLRFEWAVHRHALRRARGTP